MVPNTMPYITVAIISWILLKCDVAVSELRVSCWEIKIILKGFHLIMLIAEGKISIKATEILEPI